MDNLAQLGLIYVYFLIIILLLGLGYVGFRLVNWAVTKITGTAEDAKKASVKKHNGDPAWMRLAFLSVTILFLAIFTGGMFKVIGVGGGEGEHDHQSHSQDSSQTTMSGQTPADPATQSQQVQPNQNPRYQYPMNPYQLNQYQVNQYQLQSQLNLIAYQLSQMEAELNGISR